MQNQIIQKLHSRSLQESDVKSDLLALLMSKPTTFLLEIPTDWTNCIHVDISTDKEWLDFDEVKLALDNLVGALVHQGRHPLDLCAVKANGICSIVIKTGWAEESGVTTAA